MRVEARAHLVAQILFVPRGTGPPPQFNGRGSKQVLDAAADRSAAAVGAHRVSCAANCYLSGLTGAAPTPPPPPLSCRLRTVPCRTTGCNCPGSGSGSARGSGMIRVASSGSAAPHLIPPPQKKKRSGFTAESERTEARTDRRKARTRRNTHTRSRLSE